MSNLISVLSISILLTNLNSVGQENISESWKSNNYIDSVQILLTNKYQLSKSFSFGASSFLVKSKEDTFLCTAKHLLGQAMGVAPEIKTDDFNLNFGYWKAYPRKDAITDDTVTVSRLITEEQNDFDIILLDCKLGKENAIMTLNPRFSSPIKGERFEIIGCEYPDKECHQKIYFATMDSYKNGQILLKSELKFIPNGFSGAPVIDSMGLVIGLLSSGVEFENELYLSIEPISKVKKYLK